MKRVFVLLAILIGIVVLRGVVTREPSLDRQIIRACEIMNKDLPKMLDEITRFDRANPGPGMITYNYTLIDIDEELLTEEIKKEVEQEVRNEVRQNPDANELRRKGVDLHYIYRNESGVELHSFTIIH